MSEPLVLPEGAQIAIGGSSIAIRHTGDVVVEQTLGRRLARVESDGDVTLRIPGAEPEPHYRPSMALAEYVRMRDLTCRFPGCDKPAHISDIDHRVPWPFGTTHPSGLRVLCRLHHLLRTFWTEWTDEQHRDGTIAWTTPSGHTYITRPGSHLLFPNWNTDTGSTRATPPPAPSPARGLMMPTRRRTRQAERHYRAARERALNTPSTVDRNRPPPY